MFIGKPEQHATVYAMMLSIVTLALDYATGPYVHVPILFTVPTLLASWYRGRLFGWGLALLLPLARLTLAWHWDPITPGSMTEALINALLESVILGGLASLTAACRALQHQVRVLRGMLLICSFCKKIRDHEGHWQMLEAYIMNHSEATFSHGVCSSCVQKHYGNYLQPIGRAKQTS